MVRCYHFRKFGDRTGHHRRNGPPRQEVSEEVSENREPINTSINGVDQDSQSSENSTDVLTDLIDLLLPQNLVIMNRVLALLPRSMYRDIIPLLILGLYEEQNRQLRIINGLIDKLLNTKSVLENISDISESQRECVICQSEFKSGDVINKLECEHMFHFSCLREEIKHRDRCPICKASLLP